MRHPLASSATQRGLSLIELMIAIVILGVLAAVAVPSYTGYVQRAQRQTAAACLVELSQRMQVFHQRRGVYPTQLAQVGHDGSCPESRYTLRINDPPRAALCGASTANPDGTCQNGSAPTAALTCTGSIPRFQVEALPNAAQLPDGYLLLTRCYSGGEQRYRGAQDTNW